jgi:two-component system nitrate/nitrite response regulator NarL
MSTVCDHVKETERETRLSSHLVQVLYLLTKGLSNKQIASHTGLREGTVKEYLERSYKAIGVTSRLEAAMWVMGHKELFQPKDQQ